MAVRRHRLLRLLRLVVACLAFVVARPAAAFEPVDTITLVAAETSTRGPTAARDEAAPTSRAAQRSRLFEVAVRRLDHPRDLAELQSPRALVERKYLRHCSLLR